MKKLLYISVNSKPEELSASKTVARHLINQFVSQNQDFEVEEIDLYKAHIPRLEYQYFESRNLLIKEEIAKQLSPKERDEVQQIRKLVDQFIDATIYVIAAPMWSLSFPAPLKEYMDCIVQDKKTIQFEKDKIIGLLEDRPRTAIYVQASGGEVPWLLKPILNKGVNYIESIFKIMGIERMRELLVDGTGYTPEKQHQAVEAAIQQIPEVIEGIKF